ncbi:pyrophosphate--fructose 6-phosphate 1-phosphotransferase subunit beta [Nicotiana attenuata]|uniref:Pyrophosphate--fructose 6-phosphate 1-phosphotransferase subunit beta n=1 Tax=Nicotiana attenuata TaxID=49451 RepID=A0A1J6IQX2_NICAT|nr:pyrophosphate--fructose 6-phosphate 1-phosphotransferase subunit beta [Nicotiana attenuata]
MAATAKAAAEPGRSTSAYSEVQSNRLTVSLPLPSVLKNPFSVVDGPPSSAAGNPGEIGKLFPNLFGQPSVSLLPGHTSGAALNHNLKIGVVLSGGQAPGGHNVISGIFDYLQEKTKGSTLYGFRGGPAGIMNCKYVELTTDFVYPYRNQGGFDMIASGRDKIETDEQFKQAAETAKKLDLDGIVVIGGDDSNTNACLLAENFRGKGLKTRVIGCPKTIDGDLKCKEVPTSFGFDTACKIYAEMIGNVMIDARSTGKYYHFVRLMGRAASHITLECALQTHPNITIIGEEVIVFQVVDMVFDNFWLSSFVASGSESPLMKESHSSDVSFTLDSSGVPAGLDPPSPISEISSKAYFLWLNTMPFLDLANSIPRKNFSSPKSFILNLSLRSFLVLIIKSEQLPVTSRSSTYTKTTTSALCSSLVKRE